MSYQGIRKALDAQLSSVTGLPTHQKENTNYDKAGKALIPWVRSTLSPAEPRRLSNDTDLLNGLYVVDVFYPRHQGTDAATATVDAIVSDFARGTVLTESSTVVHILKAWPTVAQELENFYQVQVFSLWECEKPKG